MVAVSRVVMSGVRRMGSKGAGGGSAASTKEDGGHYPSMMDNMFEAACKFATFTSSRNENFRHTFLDHNAPESARAASAALLVQKAWRGYKLRRLRAQEGAAAEASTGPAGLRERAIRRAAGDEQPRPVYEAPEAG